MSLWHDVLTRTLRAIAHLLCRVHPEDLEKVPTEGPLILAANHVNFIEVPILYGHLHPRPISGMAKAESWRNPFKHILFNTWGGIPVRRGEADLDATRSALRALQAGRILAIAPEGTRSHDGRLQRGHPGVAMLALRSGAPILPVVYYGGERLWSSLRRFRRTDFHIVVGDPFWVDPGGMPVDRYVRRQMADQIMYQLAALLPPEYRGVYADLQSASETYLRFGPGASSNLVKAGCGSGQLDTSPGQRDRGIRSKGIYEATV
ncbi:MAG: 1-acyl-sn-glycerol-3-phosphate acyltransferase [Chloroflexi bacterium]|nr:1-acyl-sn-glycerol-3-phosphate acyltransferase [Chloroflexota bacterium]